MVSLESMSERIDAKRLPDGQANWLAAWISSIINQIDSLQREERTLYKHMWSTMARVDTPIRVNLLRAGNEPASELEAVVARLKASKLIWFDNELNAVLQCPPFSAVRTLHQVKVFGWDLSYASSFIDAAVTALVYGPNVWLNVQSVCAHSREPLAFRVRQHGEMEFELEASEEAENWRIWLPQMDADDAPSVGGLRSKITGYRSEADLEAAMRTVHIPGVVYTLKQALYLSSWLLFAYRRALVTRLNL